MIRAGDAEPVAIGVELIAVDDAVGLHVGELEAGVTRGSRDRLESDGTSFCVGTRWRSTASSRANSSASCFIFVALPRATSALATLFSESSVSSRAARIDSSSFFGVQYICW